MNRIRQYESILESLKPQDAFQVTRFLNSFPVHASSKILPNFFLTSALNAHFNFSGGSLEAFSMISRHIVVIAYILWVFGTPVPNGIVSVKVQSFFAASKAQELI